MFDLTKAKVAVVADSKVATVIEEKQAADDAGSNGLGLGKPEPTNINAAEVRDTVAATGASGAVATLMDTVYAGLGIDSGGGGASTAAFAASQDANTKRLFKVLQDFGLNPLRSEIVAICEFIPLAAGEQSEESALIKFEIGANQTLSVTNAARLVELHRQIRDYITEAAKLVLKKSNPELTATSFLITLKNAVRFAYKAVASVNVPRTFEKVVNTLSNQTSQDTSGTEFAQVVSENVNNPFLKSLIEYYMYEFIIEDVISYIGSIAEADIAAITNYGITKFSNFQAFSPASTFSENKISNLYATVPETDLNKAPGQLSKELLGIVRTDSNSDTDMLLNTVGQLISLIYFKDSSSVLQTLNSADNDSLTVEPNKIRIGISGDLSKTINNIKRITFPGCVAHLSTGTGQEISDGLKASVDSSSMLKDSNMFDFYRIKDASGQVQNFERGHHEMLAVMAYDTVSGHIDYNNGMTDIISELKCSSEVKALLVQANLSTQTTLYPDHAMPDLYRNLITNYLEIQTGISRQKFISRDTEVISRERLPESTTSSPPAGYGLFTREIMAKKAGVTENNDPMKYMPLESRYQELSSNDSGTLVRTGPDFYIQNSINNSTVFEDVQGEDRLSLDFESFDADMLNYAEKAENFVHDILTLVPDHKYSKNSATKGGMTPLGEGDVKNYLDQLFKSLESDMKAIVDDPQDYAPILSALLRECDNKYKVRNFAAVFWGVVQACIPFFVPEKPDLEAVAAEGGIDVPDSAESASLNTKSEANTIDNVISHFVEYYNEDAAIQLFEDNFNFKLNGSGFDKERTFQGGSGQKYTVALGDTSADLASTLNSSFKDALPVEYNVTGFTAEASGSDAKTFLPERLDNHYNRSFGAGKDDLQQIVGAMSGLSSFLSGLTAGLGVVAAVLVGVALFIAFPPAGVIIAAGSAIATVGAAATAGALTGLLAVAAAATGAAILANIANADYYGMSRVLKNSMLNAMIGNYEGIGLEIDEEGTRLSPAADLTIQAGFIDGAARNHPGVIGNIASFSTQHRGLIWYQWVHHLLSKTLVVTAQTNKNGTFAPTELTQKVYKDNIKGLIDALRQFRGEAPQYSSRSSKKGYVFAKEEADNYLSELSSVIDVRQQKIRDTCALLVTHAKALNNFKNSVRTSVNAENPDGSINRGKQLAAGFLRDEGMLSQVSTLQSDLTPALMYSAAERHIYTKPGELYPKDLKFSIAKNKFVYKVLSEPGYGFLESEKRGNKSILNVGLPAGMIRVLQTRAAERTGNSDYVNSPYVCISVFKQDHINKSYTFYPKNFVFDTTANIVDYDGDELSNHLLNFAENDSVTDLLRKIQVKRYKSTPTGDIRERSGIGIGPGVYSSEVLRNHAQDYCLKEYFKLTTGLNFDEESFHLTESAIDFSIINPSSLIGPELNSEYQKIITLLTKLYPGAENDPRFRSEVFRLTTLLRQSIPFSGRNRFLKVVTPKCFDRVYSIMVNEKDFLLDDRLMQSNASSLFTTPPQFNLGAKFERPGDVNYGYIIDLNSYYGNNNSRPFTNYIASLDENYPEVYNYFAAVSLLPLNFQPGAGEKFSSQDVADEIVAEQEAKDAFKAGATKSIMSEDNKSSIDQAFTAISSDKKIDTVKNMSGVQL